MTVALTDRAKWDTPLEDGPNEPRALARPAEVAVYLDETFANAGPGGRAEASLYCLSRGYLNLPGFSLQAVFDDLDLLGAKERRLHYPQIPRGDWNWVLNRPSYVERCPRLIWQMDRKTGRIHSRWMVCGSWLCEYCAHRRAEDLLLRVAVLFFQSKPIWYATAQESQQLGQRLRTNRRRLNGCGTLTVPRESGVVHIFSVGDLSCARSEPRGGEWLTPHEAYLKLIEEVLPLPGVAAVRFSGKWQAPRKPASTARIWQLGEADEDLIEDARNRAMSVLAAHGYGPESLEVFTPEQIQGDLVADHEKLDRSHAGVEEGSWVSCHAFSYDQIRGTRRCHEISYSNLSTSNRDKQNQSKNRDNCDHRRSRRDYRLRFASGQPSANRSELT